MNKLVSLIILITISVAAHSQNDVPTVKFPDFMRWSRTVNITGFSFGDFDYDGRGLLATFNQKNSNTTIAVRIDEISHFTDYKHSLDTYHFKEYKFNEFPAVYYSDNEYSYLNLKILSGHACGQIIVNHKVSADELEKIAVQSGILQFPLKVGAKMVEWPAEIPVDMRPNTEITSVEKGASQVQGFTTEYEVSVMMNRTLMTELSRIFGKSSGSIEPVYEGNVRIVCISGNSFEDLRERYFFGDVIRLVYYVK
jgi:hypothetical protein